MTLFKSFTCKTNASSEFDITIKKEKFHTISIEIYNQIFKISTRETNILLEIYNQNFKISIRDTKYFTLVQVACPFSYLTLSCKLFSP